jgi:hypothetical protein
MSNREDNPEYWRGWSDGCRLGKYISATHHWQRAGYDYDDCRAFAAALHGADEDVKAWGLAIAKARGIKEEDLV